MIWLTEKTSVLEERTNKPLVDRSAYNRHAASKTHVLAMDVGNDHYSHIDTRIVRAMYRHIFIYQEAQAICKR
jgi:hypothetical protein